MEWGLVDLSLEAISPGPKGLMSFKRPIRFHVSSNSLSVYSFDLEGLKTPPESRDETV